MVGHKIILSTKLESMSPVGFIIAPPVVVLVARSLSERNCWSSISFAVRVRGGCFGSCARANDVAMTERLVVSEMTRLRTNPRENIGTSNSRALIDRAGITQARVMPRSNMPGAMRSPN